MIDPASATIPNVAMTELLRSGLREVIVVAPGIAILIPAQYHQG